MAGSSLRRSSDISFEDVPIFRDLVIHQQSQVSQAHAQVSNNAKPDASNSPDPPSSPRASLNEAMRSVLPNRTLSVEEVQSLITAATRVIQSNMSLKANNVALRKENNRLEGVNDQLSGEVHSQHKAWVLRYGGLEGFYLAATGNRPPDVPLPNFRKGSTNRQM